MDVCLLFRTAKADDPYALALKETPFTPHFVSALHFKFINQDALTSALLNPSKFSGIVFTSKTAVDSVIAAMGAKVEELTKLWVEKPAFVVGPVTCEAVVSKLGMKTSGQETCNSENLGQYILEYFDTHPKDYPLLFPSSQLRREVLPAMLRDAGIGLETLTTYIPEQHPDITENLDRIMGKMEEGGCVYGVFYSPSGVGYVLEKLLEAGERNKVTVKCVAIGPTTAESLSSHGRSQAAVCVRPNPDSLVRALRTFSRS